MTKLELLQTLTNMRESINALIIQVSRGEITDDKTPVAAPEPPEEKTAPEPSDDFDVEAMAAAIMAGR